MLADDHVSAEFAAFLHARTEGIPLAVEESVRLMHDRADLIRQDGGWARRRLDRIEVPPTIRDAMLERVGRLPHDTRTVLYAVSVLSGPADYVTLKAVTGLPEDRFTAQAADALGCGLLHEAGPGQWSFRHSLACHAVYEAIPAHERRAMHLRAGRALEGRPLQPVAQLARHFRLAGDVEASCRYTEQAADLSTQSGDVATAALLLHSLVTSVALPHGAAGTTGDEDSVPGAVRFRPVLEDHRFVAVGPREPGADAGTTGTGPLPDRPGAHGGGRNRSGPASRY